MLAVLLIVWGASTDIVRGTLRERAFDILLPLLPRPDIGHPSVVVVDIDRASLARFGPWPWPRARLANIVAAVAAGHPAALALDILLAGADRFSTDGDTLLAHALSGAPVVLGFVLESANSGPDLPATPILTRATVSLPGVWRANGMIGPSPLLAQAEQGHGALVAAADPDGPIRRLPLLVMTGRVARPGLAVEAVRLAQEATALLIDANRLRIGDAVVPLGRDAMLRLTGPARAAQVISVQRLLEDADVRAALAGRIVLLGSSAPELGCLRATPASAATPSVTIHAAAIETILSGNVAGRPAWANLAEVVAAALLGLLGLLLASRLRPVPAMVLAVSACLAWAAAAAAAAPGLATLVDPAGPPAVALAGFAAAILLRFVRDEWRARLLRLSFEQHLAPEVVRRIAADPAALRLHVTGYDWKAPSTARPTRPNRITVLVGRSVGPHQQGAAPTGVSSRHPAKLSNTALNTGQVFPQFGPTPS